MNEMSTRLSIAFAGWPANERCPHGNLRQWSDKIDPLFREPGAAHRLASRSAEQVCIFRIRELQISRPLQTYRGGIPL